MGATSRRKVTLGASAAASRAGNAIRTVSLPICPPRLRGSASSLGVRGLTDIGYLVGPTDIERNRPRENGLHLAIVGAQAAVDVEIVAPWVGGLGGGDGERAGGHVDDADVFGADNVHTHVL